MQFLKFLLNALFGWTKSAEKPHSPSPLSVKTPKKSDIHSLPEFYDIDLEKLKTELNLVSEARKLGEKNIPQSSEIQLSGIEAQAQSKIEKYRTDCAAWRDNRILMQSRRLDNHTRLVMDNVTLYQDAILLKEKFDQQINHLLSERKHELVEVKREFEQAKQELTEFKQKNGLTRDAKVPSRGKFSFLIVVCLFLVLIEGGLNANFFAQGSDSGLLGGFIQAFMFAGLNVALATIQGRYTLPFVFHRNAGLKLLGVFCWLLCLVGIGLVALMVSHYRDAMALETEQVAQAALKHFLAHPFEFNDLNSWVLCAITVGFGIIAMFDGLHLNDTYPFYGKKYAHYKNAAKSYNDELQDLKSEIEAFKEQALSDVDKAVVEIKENLVEQDKMVKDKAFTHSLFNQRMEHAEKVLQGLVQTFRNENEAYRSSPRPYYFGEAIVLHDVAIEADFDIEQDRINLNKCEQIVQRFYESVPEIKRNIKRAFNEQFEQLSAVYDMELE